MVYKRRNAENRTLGKCDVKHVCRLFQTFQQHLGFLKV